MLIKSSQIITNQQITMTNSTNLTNYLLNCDWLQFSCHFNGIFPDKYIYANQGRSTRVFKNWIKIFYLDLYFADLWFVPSSPILPKLLCSIKLSNELLYNPHLFEFTRNFITDMQLTNVKISRYDLCCDFQEFTNGYKVPIFLNSLLNSKILYNCRSSFKVSGISTNFQEVHSLSFGSRSSYIYVTLYDKTKEMRETKMKNYIQKQWSEFGFDIDRPVWRLEFSLNQTSEEIVDKTTGETYPINFDFISKPYNVFHLFKAFVSKKFSFKRNEHGTNKSRFDNIKLFDFNKEAISINRWNLHKDVTRSVKIQVNQRIKHILAIEKTEKRMIFLQIKSLYNFISHHNMFGYFSKHFEFLDLFSCLSDRDRIEASYSNIDNFKLIMD